MTGNQDINDISYQFGRGGGGCGDWASNCA